MKTKLKLIAITSLAFLSCEKEEELKLSEKEQQLIGSWTKQKIESKKPNTNWEDITKNCDKDDVEEFQNGAKYALFPGTELCEGQTNVIRNGTWRLTANNTRIVFTYNGIQGEYESTIENLDGTTLILKHATGQTDQTEIRTTYIKK